MQNTQNLSQMLSDLKKHIADQTSALRTKDLELKGIETEKQTIEKKINDIEKKRNEEKKKIDTKADLEISQLTNKSMELGRSHTKVAEELTKIRLEQNSNNAALAKITRESQNAMKK